MIKVQGLSLPESRTLETQCTLSWQQCKRLSPVPVAAQLAQLARHAQVRQLRAHASGDRAVAEEQDVRRLDVMV